MAGIKPPVSSPLEEMSDSDSSEQGTAAYPKRKKKINIEDPTAVKPTGAIPKRTRKQAKFEELPEPTPSRLLKSNKFAMLAIEEGNLEPTTKKERVPPLFTPMKDLLLLQSELSQLSLKPLFKKCSIGTKIVCTSLDEYQKVSELLTNNKLPYYTHDNPSTKPLKIVLRGLPAFDEEKVLTELKNLGLKPQAVFPMSRRSQVCKDDPFRDELFLIHFTKGTTTIGALRNIKELFRVIIQWEPYRPQHRDVTQCTNCLWFGHGTRNCKMLPRCDNCAENHLSATCEQDDDIAPKCANCSGNHRATNRICPKRVEFIRIRKQASTSKQPGRVRKPSPIINSDHFPQLKPRAVVPVLSPLPLPNNNQQNRSHPAAIKSVQPRLTIASAHQPTTPTPGLSYASVTAGPSISDDSPLSTEELVAIITTAIDIKRKYKTRSQQLAAIVALIDQYGP
ncbi:uncharacterized protein LOC129738404 [Uranotaenia lowii]|uniref:uncharacterized protein LOC129738404 n=1 Tax=Uranotaenia lowii TaxID=190385 RepID=UPI00247943CD|nr:uncharacterized protein LOC129738404 [Uranotaenia lowii]